MAAFCPVAGGIIGVLMSEQAMPITVAEYEPLARERMAATPAAWDYYAGGAGDERSLADNREAWDRLRLRPRMLVDVSQRDLSTSAFGASLPHPIVVAPTAAHNLAHADAEAHTARGAAAAGALFTLSTISTVPMEDVAAAAPGAPRWFQLYAPSDRGGVPGAGRARGIRRLLGDRPDRRPAAIPATASATAGTTSPSTSACTCRPTRRSTRRRGSSSCPTMDWDELAWLRSDLPDPAARQGHPPRR